MEIFKNKAIGTLSSGYDSSATTISVSSGHGARFSSASPFYAVWWNSTDYPDVASDPNSEIVKVNSVSSDTLIVVRAQQGTVASAKNSGGKTYQIAQVPTAEYYSSLHYFNNPAETAYLFDDFEYNDVAFSTASSGTRVYTRSSAGSGSAQTFINGEISHPGITRFNSGTTTSSGSGLFTSFRIVRLDGNAISFTTWIRTVTVGSVRNRIGFGDSSSPITEFTNGVYFIYDHSSYGDHNWRFKVLNNSTIEETVNTGVEAATNKWFKLEMRSNAEATNISLFINDSYVGAATANLPTGDGKEMGLICQNKNSGSVGYLDLDAWRLLIKFNNRRH